MKTFKTSTNKGQDELRRLEQESKELEAKIKKREDNYKKEVDRSRAMNKNINSTSTEERELQTKFQKLESDGKILNEEYKNYYEHLQKAEQESVYLKESKVSEKAENARLGKTYEIATENLDTTTKECNMKIENFKRSEIDELRFERECDQAEKLKREEEKYIRDLNETMYQKQNELKQRFSKRIQQQNELISRMYEIIKTQNKTKYHYFKSREPVLKSITLSDVFVDEISQAKKSSELYESKYSLALIEEKKKEEERQRQLELEKQKKWAWLYDHKRDYLLLALTLAVVMMSDIQVLFA